jgi:hypothetical protein
VAFEDAYAALLGAAGEDPVGTADSGDAGDPEDGMSASRKAKADGAGYKLH